MNFAAETAELFLMKFGVDVEHNLGKIRDVLLAFVFFIPRL